MVELRIGDLGGEILRSPVQLRMRMRRRSEETGRRRKDGVREGNNPDYS